MALDEISFLSRAISLPSRRRLGSLRERLKFIEMNMRHQAAGVGPRPTGFLARAAPLLLLTSLTLGLASAQGEMDCANACGTTEPRILQLSGSSLRSLSTRGGQSVTLVGCNFEGLQGFAYGPATEPERFNPTCFVQPAGAGASSCDVATCSTTEGTGDNLRFQARNHTNSRSPAGQNATAAYGAPVVSLISPVVLSTTGGEVCEEEELTAEHPAVSTRRVKALGATRRA